MYRKKPSGETFYASHVVYVAEYNKRRLSTARSIVALSLVRMSDGLDMHVQRVLYVNSRLALRYTKKGYYSRIVKQLRSNIV